MLSKLKISKLAFGASVDSSRERSKNKCIVIAIIVIIQCVAVFAASITVLHCTWSPDHVATDFHKLLRIMYLYDHEACGYKLRKAGSKAVVVLSNTTTSSNLLPIKWSPPVATVSTRLSAKTRRYIELSITVHVVWMLCAMAMWMFIRQEEINVRILKIILRIFFYTTLFVVTFDISMAIVYVSHIKQSVNNGMVLRYSGWTLQIKLQQTEPFAGWIPILASVCWLRGVIVLIMNIYFLKVIRRIRKVIKRKEVKNRIQQEGNLPFPNAEIMTVTDQRTLYYRSGEKEPEIIYPENFK